MQRRSCLLAGLGVAAGNVVPPTALLWGSGGDETVLGPQADHQSGGGKLPDPSDWDRMQPDISAGNWRFLRPERPFRTEGVLEGTT